MKVLLALGCLLVALTGCSSVTTKVDTKEDLRHYHAIYVQSAPNDSNHLDDLMAAELQRLGYEASSGVRTMMPEKTQLVLTYDGQWTWDFRTYLLRLDVRFFDVRLEKPVGTATVIHPGYTTKSPEQLIALLLDPIFGPKH